MLFLGNKGVAPSGLFDEKAETLLVLRATSGLVMDNGGVAKGFVRFDVDTLFPVVVVVVVVVEGPALDAVALARNCASAEPVPGPTALAVTRFFLEILGQHCIAWTRMSCWVISLERFLGRNFIRGL